MWKLPEKGQDGSEEKEGPAGIQLDVYINSVCEIRSEQNDLLTTARIQAIGEDEISFIQLEEAKLPVIPYRTPVKIGIINARNGFCMLAGLVYISLDNLLRVSNIQVLQSSDRRRFFRIKVNIKTNIYLASEEEMEKEGLEKLSVRVEPTPVKVEDISLSGIQVSTEEVLEDRATFILEIRIFSKPLTLCCRVMRVMHMEEENRFYYGCMFIEQNSRQSDSLCRDLLHLQRMEIERMRQQ